ncbi:MAG: RnfABCDGE type electron transport complex subunit D [Massiliimalia sp.]|jgi:electron transport complex protein RnfD
MENRNQQSAMFLLCMAVLMVIPVYLYGLRPLVILLVAVVSAMICDFIFNRLFHFSRRVRDLSSIEAAMAIALMMPASVDYSVVVAAVVIGLVIAKYPFGGAGNQMFHPAAVGMCVAALSFGENVFRFPVPKTQLPLTAHISDSAVLYTTSPASTLNIGGTPKIAWFDLLLGNFAGPMGATCILVLLFMLIFLVLRRVISLYLTGGFLLTAAVYAFLFPRVSTGRLDSVLFELTSGILLFGVIFLASDRATSPQTRLGQLLYGICLALAAMIFRTVGSLDVEFVFVLLFMNVLSVEFDRLGGVMMPYIRQGMGKLTGKAGAAK